MRGERENDSSESTTSRRRAISPTTCVRSRATRAWLAGSCAMSSTAMPRPLSAFLSSCAMAAEVLPMAAKRSASTSASCVATSSCVRSCTRCSSSAGPLAQLLIALLDRRLHVLERPQQRRDLLGPGRARRGPSRRMLAARDADRARGQRLQRARQVGRQQHAGDGRHAGCRRAGSRPASPPAARGWRSASARARRRPPRTASRRPTGA